MIIGGSVISLTQVYHVEQKNYAILKFYGSQFFCIIRCNSLSVGSYL